MKTITHKFLPTLIILVSLLSYDQSVFGKTRMDDSLALVSFYNFAGGTSWTNLWYLNQPIDTWDGATLSNDGGSIFGFDRNSALSIIPSCITTNITENIPCKELNNSSIDLTVSGGTPPYNFNWSNGLTTEDIASLGIGTYTITVTDGIGCSVTAQSVIPDTISMTYDVVQPSCDIPLGAIDITVTGGGLPINYTWSNGATTQDLSGLSSGTYSLTLTDVFGCIDTLTQVINSTVLATEINLIAAINCSGGSDGIVSTSTSGGPPPYTYLWDNGETTPGISNLSSGLVSVTVTDFDGCTTVDSYEILEILPLISGFIFTSEPTCFGNNDGVAVVNVNGGTLPYFYLWSNGATVPNVTGLSGTSGGSYQVTITDFQGCTATNEVFIDEPEPVTLNAFDTIMIDCNGNNTGAVTAFASGGTAPYNYVWSSGQNSQLAFGLSAGSYSVTSTDVNGCSETTSIVLTEPDLLSAISTQQSNVLCFGYNDGDGTVAATGGTPPYSYIWDNGDANAQATGLVAGIYVATITDANSCSVTSGVTITQPPVFEAMVNLVSPINCAGFSDGVVSVSASGGVAPYTYLWTTAETTVTISNLPAGIITVTITDFQGCMASESYNIPQTLPLTSGFNFISEPTCFGFNDGIAVIDVNGGTLPYSYLWSNSATVENPNNLEGPSEPDGGLYDITITDFRGCVHTNQIFIDEPEQLGAPINITTPIDCQGNNNGAATATASGGITPYSYSWDNGQNTPTATGLSAGNYSVTILDNNACFFTTSTIITEPAFLNASITTSTDVLCNGEDNGTATVVATGGTPPYNYNWDNGELTDLANNLNAGVHLVTVTDINLCEVTASVQINEPTTLTASANPTNVVNCFGGEDGAALVTASGGTPNSMGNYSFTWDNGETTAEATNLDAGTHQVTVTDILECVTTASVYITEPTAPLSVDNITINDPTCGKNDGSLTITITGGTPAYQYSINGMIFQTSSTFNNLGSGNYTITIMDINNCTETAMANLIDSSGPEIVMVNNMNATCGLTNGEITITASNGTAPYQYSIDGGTNFQSGSVFTNLAPGSFDIFIQDVNGCSTMYTNMVILTSQPAPIIDSISVVDPPCQTAGGSLVVFGNNGTPPFQYSIDGGTNFQFSSTFSSLLPGNYSIIMEDVNGCQVIGTAGIQNISGPSILSLDLISNTHCGMSSGSFIVQTVSGTPPLNYILNNTTNQAIPTFSNLSSGVYVVEVLDVFGCSSTSNITLPEIQGPSIDTIIETDPICNLSNGSLQIITSFGTGTLLYSIDGFVSSQASNLFTGLAPGSYTVEVIDTMECHAMNTVSIVNHPSPNITFMGVTSSYCDMGIGEITIFASGGTPPLQYSIDGANYQASSFFDNLAEGSYTAIVADVNNCIASQNVFIQNLQGPTIAIQNQNESACGMANGSVIFQSTGGIGPYEYSSNNDPFTANNSLVGLSAGVYEVIVRDVNNCQDTLQFTMTNILGPSITSINTTDPTCGNANGDLTIVATGVTPPLLFSINGGINFIGSNFFSGLLAGGYDIVVQDANGCMVTWQTTLVDQGLPSIAGVVINPSTCGNDNGSITILASGGTIPWNYSIDGGSTYVTNNIFNNLGASNYQLMVSDANNCLIDSLVTLTNIEGAIFDSISISQPACGMNSGSLTVYLSEGTSPFNYSIDSGVTTQSSSTFVGLTEGGYTIQVIDTNGCLTIGAATLIDQNGPIISGMISQNTFCDSTGGSLKVEVINGLLPFSYQWNTSPAQLSDLATGLSPGIYTVIITDSNNCTVSASGLVDTPTPPIVDLDNDFLSCDLVSYTLDAENPGADYLWSTGETTQTINALTYDIYAVTVTDNNVCTAIDSITITKDLFSPFLSADTTIIAGEMANLLASGGTTYNWFPQDGLSCWNCPDPVASPLETTIYSVEIANSSGCIDTLHTEVKTVNSLFVLIDIPTAFSPNDDGINDNWVIPYIEYFSNNTLSVINRWGDVVFEAAPYQNNWTGTYKGKSLPQGTYYYLLELDVNRYPTLKGSLTILK